MLSGAFLSDRESLNACLKRILPEGWDLTKTFALVAFHQRCKKVLTLSVQFYFTAVLRNFVLFCTQLCAFLHIFANFFQFFV